MVTPKKTRKNNIVQDFVTGKNFSFNQCHNKVFCGFFFWSHHTLIVPIGYLIGKRIFMWAFLSYMRIQSIAGVVVNFMNSMRKKEVPYSVDYLLALCL